MKAENAPVSGLEGSSQRPPRDGLPAGAEIALVQDGLAAVDDAVRFLGLSRSTIYLLMESGQLPYVKIGRARRIPRRALVELAARNIQGGWRAESVTRAENRSSSALPSGRRHLSHPHRE